MSDAEHSGTFTGFEVHARVEHMVRHRPIGIDQAHGKVMLTEEWTRISYPEDGGCRHVGAGLFDNEASAMAAAWQLVSLDRCNIQAKVIPVHVSYSCERVRDMDGASVVKLPK